MGSGLDDPDADELVKSGKRGQITDQLVELPMEHQIYDMIDAEGPKGLTVIEVCILISCFFLVCVCRFFSQGFLTSFLIIIIII